jgi:hypothetical protein
MDVARLRPENDEADDLIGCAKAYTGRRSCQGRHFLQPSCATGAWLSGRLSYVLPPPQTFGHKCFHQKSRETKSYLSVTDFEKLNTASSVTRKREPGRLKQAMNLIVRGFMHHG